MSKRSIILRSILRLSQFILSSILFLFVPAGSLGFIKGWLAIIALALPAIVLGIFLINKNPRLLLERLEARENSLTQRRIVFLSSCIVAISAIASGLAYRYSFTPLPSLFCYVAVLIYFFALLIYAQAFSVNPYLARTIKTVSDQRLVDYGIYSKIRHPLYLGSMLLYLSIALIFSYPVTLLLLLPMMPLLKHRIKNEERFLERNLNGYIEYEKKVQYRLIPHLW